MLLAKCFCRCIQNAIDRERSRTCAHRRETHLRANHFFFVRGCRSQRKLDIARTRARGERWKARKCVILLQKLRLEKAVDVRCPG